jgi:hypothetical protein
MESSALGPCRVPLHVPSRMSMLQTLARCECKIALETTGLLSGHMRIFVLRSLAARKLDSLCGSFEIWDLGSHGGGSTARATTTSTTTIIRTSSSRLRAPGANVVDRSSSKRRGFGSNMTFAVLGSLGSDAPVPWTSSKEAGCSPPSVCARVHTSRIVLQCIGYCRHGGIGAGPMQFTEMLLD